MKAMRADTANARNRDLSYLSLLALTVVILLFSFAVGARGLNADLVWNDELASLTNFGAFNRTLTLQGVIELMQQYSPADVPVFPWIGYIWARLAGWSQFALRSLSLFAGVLMIAQLNSFASRVFDRRVAVVASYLIGSSSFVLLYFHELRTYTIFMLFVTIYLTAYWELAFAARATFFPRLLIPICTVVLLYTTIISLVFFATLAIIHVLFAPKRRQWIEIVLSWVLGAMFMLPFAASHAQGVGLVTNDGLAASAPEVLCAFLRLAVNGLDFLWAPLIAVVCYALWKTANRDLLRLIAFAAIMVALLLLANDQFALIAVTRIRYFLLAWILLVVIFACGLVSLPRWKLPTVVLLAIWFVAGSQFGQSADFSTYYAGAKASASNAPPLSQIVTRLRGRAGPQDFLLGFYESYDPNYVWQVHSAGSVADYYLNTQLGIDGAFLHANRKRYRLEEDVRSILRSHPHVLLAHDPLKVPLNYARTLAIIEEDYLACASLVEERALRIRKYAHPVMGCNHQPAPIDYDNDIRLIDRAARYDADAEVVQALTWWDVPDGEMLNQYNVSLQIITSDWQNIRQIDRHLYDGLVPWSVIELSTADLLLDDYQLMLILYNRENGSKVPGVDELSGESAGILPIASFSIDT